MTLLDLEDAIAEQVADAVLPHLTGEERAQISESGTNNGAAHAAYLRGRWYWRNSAGDREKLLRRCSASRKRSSSTPSLQERTLVSPTTISGSDSGVAFPLGRASPRRCKRPRPRSS